MVVARTGSSRLPGKVLLPVKGRPLVSHQIERLRQARRPHSIILCTTTAPADSQLTALAGILGVEAFRGNELDVPRRLLDAAEWSGTEFIVLAEADEHFADPHIVDCVVDAALESGADFVSIEGVPLGAYLLGFKTSALRTICAERPTEGIDGWGAFFTSDPRLYCVSIKAPPHIAQVSERLRLTVDYPEDFQLILAIYDRLYRSGVPLRLEDVIALVTHEPELLAINSHLNEVYWKRIRENHKGATS